MLIWFVVIYLLILVFALNTAAGMVAGSLPPQGVGHPSPAPPETHAAHAHAASHTHHVAATGHHHPSSGGAHKP